MQGNAPWWRVIHPPLLLSLPWLAQYRVASPSGHDASDACTAWGSICAGISTSRAYGPVDGARFPRRRYAGATISYHKGSLGLSGLTASQQVPCRLLRGA